MEAVLGWSIPGGTLLMVAAGLYELRRQKRGNKTGAPLTAACTDEYTAVFYGTKRMELDHRDSVAMLREEEAQGGPPGVDLDAGTAVLRPAGDRAGRARPRAGELRSTGDTTG